MKDLIFVTGNQHKADKTAELLGRKLAHHKLDLDEIQTIDIRELVEHKARQAYEIINSPIIVDDYGLGLHALNGLPGPFVKFFIESNDGLEKMCRMIDPFDDRGASTKCGIGFYDGSKFVYFEKQTRGEISEYPMGDNGIHTDKIFVPEGYDKTRAQMDHAEYNEVYRKVRPLDELKIFLDQYYA